jgi:transposase
MFFDNSINADIFELFCEKLIKGKDCPVYLIVDNLRVHRAKVLSPWFDEQKALNKLLIFYLPSYSPELNPDEYLNRDIKAHLAEKTIPKSKKALKMAIQRHLTNR